MRSVFLLVGGIGLLFLSCKKDKPAPPAPNCPQADTATITYSSYVARVMQQHCTSCHGGPSPSKGISLETYEQVRQANASGKWYRSMENGSMPPSGKLDDCTLAKLKKWVDSGYPE